MTSCERCAGGVPKSGDIADLYEFEMDSPSLVYHDGILAGFARCKQCRQRYWAQSSDVVLNLLWHWTLLPVADTVESAGEAASSDWWVSLLEDARGGAHSLHPVRIQGPPPRTTARQRKAARGASRGR